MRKKIISLLLAGALSFGISACSKENLPKPQNNITYSETEIGANSGLRLPAGSRVNSKNQLLVFDRGDGINTRFAVLDQDGKPVGEIKGSFSGNISFFALDQQDNIYALVNESNGGERSQKVQVISPSGQVLKDFAIGQKSAGTNKSVSGNAGGASGGKANISGPAAGDGSAKGPVTGGSSAKEPAGGGSTVSGGSLMPNTVFMDIAVDKNGTIYLANPSENYISVLSNDGIILKTLGAHGYDSVDVDSEGNVLAGNFFMGKRAIDKLNAATGEIIWSQDLSSSTFSGIYFPGSEKVRFSKSDNGVYYFNSKGISKYDSTGKAAGNVIIFASYTILASGYTVSDMCMGASNHIFITTISSAGMNTVKGPSSPESAKYEIYKYSPQTGSAQTQKVITVSVPASSRALEMAASKFQKEHPGYRINIETYPNQDNTGGDYENYINNLNTQILSGKGPDIISVGGLPYDKYISKNILSNLSEMMKNDKNFDPNKYYSNILDGLKTNGNLYVMPTSFSFNVMMANQAVLDQKSIKPDDGKWSWKDFESIANLVTDKEGGRSALPGFAAFDLLTMLTGGSFESFIAADRKSSNFNSAAFKDLLNVAKVLCDGEVSNDNVKTDMVSILDGAGRGSIVFYPDTLTDYNMYGFMKAAFNNQLGLYNIPTEEGSGSRTFTADSMYAINKNSKYQSECWEFIKMLISDDVQMINQQGAVAQSKSKNSKMDVLGGFSINKAAQQQKAEQAIDATQNGRIKIGIGSSSGVVTLSPSPLTQADIDYIDRFISGLNKCAVFDENIYGIVSDETKAFFAGDKTIDETARLIESRVNTYLGE